MRAGDADGYKSTVTRLWTVFFRGARGSSGSMFYQICMSVCLSRWRSVATPFNRLKQYWCRWKAPIFQFQENKFDPCRLSPTSLNLGPNGGVCMRKGGRPTDSFAGFCSSCLPDKIRSRMISIRIVYMYVLLHMRVPRVICFTEHN